MQTDFFPGKWWQGCLRQNLMILRGKTYHHKVKFETDVRPVLVKQASYLPLVMKYTCTLLVVIQTKKCLFC